jgi:protein-tyrosine phosphatase
MREVKRAPNVNLGEGVKTYHIPLLGGNMANSEEMERLLGGRDYGMRGLYHLMLENRDGVRACMNAIANAPDGCVLFHCAVGKDRTGLLAILLLSLAGVDRWDIISNYMQSRIHLMRDGVYAADWADPKREMFHAALDSPPEMAEYVCDLIDSEYGGIVRYLLECEVTSETIEAVCDRLIGDPS